MAELDKINVNGELYDMSDSKARSDIASEITNRTNADKALDDKVKTETEARTSADNALNQKIAQETTNRTNADNALQTAVNAEAQTRLQADTDLQTNIGNEATARTNADNALQEKINTNKNDISVLKGDLANKLPKSPANWGPWTAEEQAAALDRMGIDKPFELIETIKIDTDDIGIIKRDVEPDGTPYNFESMMVRVTSFGTNMSGLLRCIYAHLTDESKFDFEYSWISNSMVFNDSYLLCEKRNGLWITSNILSHTNGIARGYYAQPGFLNIDKKTITGVNIYFYESNFIVGTEIKIYGVRA